MLHEEFVDYRTLDEIPNFALKKDSEEERLDIIWFFFYNMKSPVGNNVRFNKDRRRQLRSKQKHVCQKGKESYISGAFGITSTPEYKKNCSSRKKKQGRLEEARKPKTLRRRELIHVEADDNHCNIEPRIQCVLPLTDRFTAFCT